MSFYKSKEWKRLRWRHLKYNPTCAIKGCAAQAVHVDHIVTVRNAPNRALDPSNLQSLCTSHHNQLTSAYDKGSIAGACDDDGNPLDPNHPWNQASQADAIKAVNRPPIVSPELQAKLKRRLSEFK